MQQKPENSNKPQVLSKQKILIIILLMIAVVTSWYNRGLINTWFKNYNHEIVQQVSTSGSKEQDSQVTTKGLSSTYTAAETKEIDGDQQQLYANASQTTHNENKLQDEHDNIIHINNYRRYLHNVNGLIANFLQDKVYSNEIAYVRILSLPPSIEETLELFEEYNIDYLINPDERYKKIFPKDCKVSAKFIKIRKLTDKSRDKEKLKAKIMNNLEIFQDYIYSEALQNIFIRKRE